MKRQVLFVQGAGQGAYEEDARLAASLGDHLGPDYEVRYPEMPDEDSPDDAAWCLRLAEELATMGEGAVLVGHSAGAATLLMFLIDRKPGKALAGIVLVAAPFFGHEGWDGGGFELPRDLGAALPDGVPVLLYHGRDDEIVPVAHVDLYARAIPQAIVRRLDGRNHQLNDDLSEVASDIRLLA